MCRQQRGARTESAVRYWCGPTRGEKESAERVAASICGDGTEVPIEVPGFLQASVHVTVRSALQRTTYRKSSAKFADASAAWRNRTFGLVQLLAE